MHEELFCQVKLGLVVLCHNQKSRGILVDAMYKDSHPFILSVRALRDTEMVSKSVYEGTAEVSVTRVDHHSGLLVDHKNIVVFMYHIERNSLRQDLESAALVRHHELDHIARTDHIIRLDDLFVHTDIFCLDGELDTVARGVLHMGRKILVDTHRHLTCRNVEPVMFEHFLLFVLICDFVAGSAEVYVLYRVVFEFEVIIHR